MRRSLLRRIFGRRSKKTVRQLSMKFGFIYTIDRSGKYTKHTFTDCSKFGVRTTKMQSKRTKNIEVRCHKL